MLIVLNGIQNVGKEELAVRLTNRIIRSVGGKVTIIRMNRVADTNGQLIKYMLPLLEYRPNTGEHIICTYGHWSRIVQHAITGLNTDIPNSIRMYLDLFLASKGAVSAVVTDSFMNIRKKTDTITGAMLRNSHSMFEHLLTISPLVSMIWSQQRVDIDSMIGTALRTGRTVSALSTYRTYVGPGKPDVLICGRPRPETVCRDYNDICPALPAFLPTSKYPHNIRLLEGLADVSSRLVTEGTPLTFGMCATDDVDDVGELCHALKNPKVVTLGTKTDKAFNTATSGAPHGVVRHLVKMPIAFNNSRYADMVIRSALECKNYLNLV